MGNVCLANGNGRGGRPPVRPAGGCRLWTVLVLAATIAGAGLGVAPRGVAAQGAALVDAALLNVRAEPGTWSWVVAQLGPGEAVDLLSGPTPDGWYQVQSGGLTGWAHGGFLLVDGAPAWAAFEGQSVPEVVATETDPTTIQGWTDPVLGAETALGVGGAGASAWVNQNDLRVLAAPNDQAGVVDLLGAGDAVTVTGGAVGGFVPIQHWSGQAWVWNGAVGEGAPAGPERWVDVSRSTQTVTLYEGDQAVASYWAALGIDRSDAGFFATANGSYRVYEKYADLSWTIYGNAWVSDWVAFDPNRLNGFHSYSMDWAGRVIPGGDGPTGGCVALAPWAADHLFSFLQLGSRVEVHW